MGFPGGTSVKNPPVNAGDTGDAGSIPGMGRPPGEGKASHFSILAWKIPWTEEPGCSESMQLQSRMTEQLNTHTYKYIIQVATEL